MAKKIAAAAKTKAPAKPKATTVKKVCTEINEPDAVIIENVKPGDQTPVVEDPAPIIKEEIAPDTVIIEEVKTGDQTTDAPKQVASLEDVLNKQSIISVVIPYLASAASGEELLYALRAWEENFHGCQIVIIGDRPDFISDEVIHIPAIANFKSPQLDVTAKLLQAIASELISEDFILSNDDIYPVNPIELADIADLKCAGFLGSTKRNANPAYRAKIFRTMELLQSRKLPFYDYSTHTPFLFNKTRLAKVIARYKADQEPLLVSSLYFNTCFPKDIPEVIKGGSTGDLIGYVYRENPNVDVLKEAFLNRKFINHNSEGYSAVLPFLKTFFPDKSKFEL